MPVEVSRKKALALSIERSESRITIQKICMHSIKMLMPVYGLRGI